MPGRLCRDAHERTDGIGRRHKLHVLVVERLQGDGIIRRKWLAGFLVNRPVGPCSQYKPPIRAVVKYVR